MLDNPVIQIMDFDISSIKESLTDASYAFKLNYCLFIYLVCQLHSGIQAYFFIFENTA